MPATLVVSDLHLGAGSAADVLRREPALERLLAALEGVERLVLLGDTVEFRQRPAHEALAVAGPVLAELGRAMRGGEILVLAGNHDHVLVRRRLESGEPLGLEERLAPAAASAAAEEVARLLGGGAGTVSFAYPGAWLRPDVYALHGHYVDRHLTIPTFERLAAGAMNHVAGRLPEEGAEPGDYEAALAPLYAWIHALAQSSATAFMGRTAGSSAAAWRSLTRDGGAPVPGSWRRRLGFRALSLALPVLVAGLNRAGIGPLRPGVSADELRRAGLEAIGEVVARLDVGAQHVIFGHTHRSGPLPADDPDEWRAPTGARLHNTGSWTFGRHFIAGEGAANPYWPGVALRLDEAPGTVPERLTLLADVPDESLAPA